MAATASTVFASTPKAGVDLDAKSSTPAFAPLDQVLGNDARRHIYAKAAAALGSTATIAIGAAGSATASSAGTNLTVNTTGGVANGHYFWARTTSI